MRVDRALKGYHRSVLCECLLHLLGNLKETRIGREQTPRVVQASRKILYTLPRVHRVATSMACRLHISVADVKRALVLMYRLCMRVFCPDGNGEKLKDDSAAFAMTVYKKNE